jgi:hypothetical protein
VTSGGNDTSGDGSLEAPFATAQKAVDAAIALTPTTASPVRIHLNLASTQNITLNSVNTAAALGQVNALIIAGLFETITSVGTVTIDGAAFMSLERIKVNTITHATASGALKIRGVAATIGSITSRRNDVEIDGAVFVESITLSGTTGGTGGTGGDGTTGGTGGPGIGGGTGGVGSSGLEGEAGTASGNLTLKRGARVSSYTLNGGAGGAGGAGGTGGTGGAGGTGGGAADGGTGGDGGAGGVGGVGGQGGLITLDPDCYVLSGTQTGGAGGAAGAGGAGGVGGEGAEGGNQGPSGNPGSIGTVGSAGNRGLVAMASSNMRVSARLTDSYELQSGGQIINFDEILEDTDNRFDGQNLLVGPGEVWMIQTKITFDADGTSVDVDIDSEEDGHIVGLFYGMTKLNGGAYHNVFGSTIVVGNGTDRFRVNVVKNSGPTTNVVADQLSMFRATRISH